MNIARQRCFNHVAREAVAQCPECSRFFCRECITDHEGRAVCASCLATIAADDAPRRKRLTGLLRIVAVAANVVLLWVLFFMLGRGLLALPSSFHEDVLWRASVMEADE
ncbi:MAG: rhomboid family protein [bacterium]|nr:rhomboid family protein [bacterium]